MFLGSSWKGCFWKLSFFLVSQESYDPREGIIALNGGTVRLFLGFHPSWCCWGMKLHSACYKELGGVLSSSVKWESNTYLSGPLGK